MESVYYLSGFCKGRNDDRAFRGCQQYYIRSRFYLLCWIWSKGAAIATVLSQLASCVYVLFFFWKAASGADYLWRISKELMARVLVLGLSPLITASDSGLIIIMNMLIRHYGS